jgi:hypothetical protein
VLAYTLARLALFVGALAVLSLVGLHGPLLVIVAFLISAVLSVLVLGGPRNAMSQSLADRVTRIRSGLDEGAHSEDNVDGVDEVDERR